MQIVKDIMTPNPSTCQLTAGLSTALNIMRNEDVGAVPIVDIDRKLVGIITDRDIALAFADRPEKAPQDLRIEEVIPGGEMISVSPEDSLTRAAELMEQYQIRRLPVQDESGQCIGILSQADIALNGENPYRTAELVESISR